MDKPALWSAALLGTLLSTAAMAQEAPYSQTLNEQLMRVRAGQPAVPTMQQGGSPAGQSEAVPVPQPVAPDGEIIHSQGGGAIPALPLQAYKTPTGLQYITGGIGDEELAQLESVKNYYNTQLLLASTSGAYLSGVAVRIRDAGGNDILAVPEAGPYLYTHLPAGKYSISATNPLGVTHEGSFTVKEKGVTSTTVRFPD